mmetsp:Transcript_14605/g.43902  ORF Transcript_14605/g.43902 Transcript_14605/m.43902 type:complete len:234 (+) Transcript_14605:141-842(+)
MQRLGLSPDVLCTVQQSALGVCYMATLFLGPLVVSAMATHRAGMGFVKALRSSLADWRLRFTHPSLRYHSVRNYVWAPLSEEIVFRGCVTALLTAGDGGPSRWRCALLAPLLFGVAHLHHYFSRVSEGTPAGRARVETVVQLAYTWLFGFLAFLLLFGAGLPAAVGGHVFCNTMGLPDLSFLSKEGGYYSDLHGLRHGLLLAYVAGVVLFVIAMRRLTSDFGDDAEWWPRSRG